MTWMVVFPALVWLLPARAQDAAIEAVLSSELKADRLDAGSTFTLKVRSPWEHEGCRLAPGMLLHATVQGVERTPGGHVRKVRFALGAPCGDRQPLELVVTSLLAPPKIETNLEQFPGFGSFGGGAQSATAANAATFSGGDSMRGTAQAVVSSRVTVTKLPETVKLGEVWHLPRVKLLVPAGNSTVSTVSTTGSSLHLPEDTVVILQRARSLTQAESPTAIAAALRRPAVPRSVRSFVSPCRASSCHTYPSVPAFAGFGFQKLGDTRDLAGLGFRAEHDREVSALGLGATVQFLSEEQVLITFPTHALVKRTGTERPTDKPRWIRAVLFDMPSRSVMKVMDWKIEDDNGYLWPFGQGVLVHEGRALKVYGPGLAEVASLPLEMPLAALRASPDGRHLLLGELNELHTPDEHRALVEGDKHGPEEEVRWSLLDAHLQRRGELADSSNRVPTPVLLNDGMVELRKGRDPEWFLVGRTWEGGAERQMGSLRSSCLPVLGGVAPDLLTVGTCDVSGDGMHTFVAREDGSPVVEQVSGSQDLPLAFVASSASRRVAMMMTRASEAYQRGLLFHLSVIQSQAIEVLGADRGEVVARVPVPETAPYREPFALSPDGDMLAVVGGYHLTLYAVGQ